MGIRILVIDDDEMIRTFVYDALSLKGYEVDTASNGNEAIEMLKQKSYYLVITDYMMPTINGYELIEWLRKRDSSIPVILISGSESIMDMELCDSIVFLKKPFGVSELYETVISVLMSNPPH